MKSAGRLPSRVIALEALCPPGFCRPGLTGPSALLSYSYVILPQALLSGADSGHAADAA